MIGKPDIITGCEPALGQNIAIDALIGFYRAFNERDLAAMAQNWLSGDKPSMDNPIGGVRRGWPAISSGYERLCGGQASVTVEFFDFTEYVGDNFALFVGRERGVCATPSGCLDLRIRTSRLFVKRDGAWRQLHHHGSIEEPHLLEEYQRLVLGAPLGAPA